MNRQEKIAELIQLHKKQRGWQRLIYNEELDIDKVNALTDKQLDTLLKDLKEGK